MPDPALLRPGRFDRQVLVDRPDRIGRREILRGHAVKVQLAPNVDLDQIAGLTPGFTGADLANLVIEAAIVATQRNGGKPPEPRNAAGRQWLFQRGSSSTRTNSPSISLRKRRRNVAIVSWSGCSFAVMNRNATES